MDSVKDLDLTEVGLRGMDSLHPKHRSQESLVDVKYGLRAY